MNRIYNWEEIPIGWFGVVSDKFEAVVDGDEKVVRIRVKK